MKVLVFGGSGFLGQYIVEELLSRSFKVTIFDKSFPKKIKKNKFRFIKGDVQNKKKSY